MPDGSGARCSRAPTCSSTSRARSAGRRTTGRSARLAYIDSDPVFTQVKLNLPRGQLKFRRRVAAHDVHFSFGERLPGGAPPTPFRWRPTRQPVVLSEWRAEGRAATCSRP